MQVLRHWIRLAYVLTFIGICAAVVGIETGRWVVLAFPNVQIEFRSEGMHIPAQPGLYERALAAAQSEEVEEEPAPTAGLPQ